MVGRSTVHRISTAVLTLAALGAGRIVIAPPERCASIPVAGIDAAATSAVAWFSQAQTAAGTWLYRYDADRDVDLGGYNWVRHAGVMLSLEQAASRADASSDAESGADRIAEDGQTAIRARLVRTPVGLGLDDGGGVLSTGGTSLFGLALAEREHRVSDARDAALLADLGRFVASQVQPNGSVLEAWAKGAPVPGSTSPFTTGEALFFLARLEKLAPGVNHFEPTIRRVTRYLATQRADAEGFVPDASDHWAAYALAEMGEWPGTAGALNHDERVFARRQMGIIGTQIRWESQRSDRAPNRWVRGSRTSGASLGTLGEAAAAWTRVAQREPSLSDQLGGLTRQVTCAASMLADRQISAAEAEAFVRPDRAAGAFLRFGITQMDDQQHSLSALVAASDIAKAPTLAQAHRRSPVPSTAALAALVMIVAINPFRGGRGRGVTWRTVTFQFACAAAVIGALIVAGGPVLRALDVSAPVGIVAAGIVVALGAAISMVANGAGATLGDRLLARPQLAIAAIALGAGGRGWSAALASAIALATAAAVAVTAGSAPIDVGAPAVASPRWLARLVDAVGVVVGMALIVQGVFAV
jgi:hypothetical protein